ncbi:MAG: DUF58 domain-containing protein [Clostridia bacterium]|nr:DUF58 domain-containing protein [Clostridia bacterium]
MFYLAVLLAVIAVYLAQMWLYRRHMRQGLSYTVRLSTEEAFEDEDIFYYDELVNDKLLPIPFLKVNSDLPQGLYFHFLDAAADGKEFRESHEAQVQSIFVLQPHQKISRRWRVTCKKRGVYTMGDAVLVTNDLFGMNTASFSASALPGYVESRLTVLPKPIDLNATFVAADGLSGDIVTNHGLLTDPLIRAGTREYRPGDAMRQVNWKSTAVHGHLMVNIEEHFRRFVFNIVINMQSRDIEKHPEVPSAPYEIERCISVAATLLDRASDENVPTRLILNAPYKSIRIDDPHAVSCIDLGDPVGRKIAISRSYAGRMETLDALRLLAGIPMEISVPEEQMLDHIIANPALYTEAADHSGAANLIVVSSYISERMIHFHRAMEALGVRVIYYITSANRNALVLPEDIEIYFSVGSLGERDYKR